MSRYNGIYDEKLSAKSNRMIARIDNGIDERPLPILAFDIDPTITEICDSVDYLIKSGWLGGTLFARKVTYHNHYDRDKIDSGVLFTHKEDVFENCEKCGFYYIVKESPLVIGLDHDRYLKGQYEKAFPQETVLVKFDDGEVLTRSAYQEKLDNMEKPVQYKKRRKSKKRKKDE